MTKKSSGARILSAMLASSLAIGGAGIYVSFAPHLAQAHNLPGANAATSAPMAMTSNVAVGAAPFALTDMNGKTVTEKSFPDKFKLVYFGFTHCTDSCPLALQTITHALKALGPDAEKVQPMFISVDPKRDTREVMKKYLTNFSPAILGVVGTAKQTEAAENSYKVYASAPKDPNRPHHMHMDDGTGDADVVNHSDNIYLMNPGNGFVNVFGGDVNADTLTHAMQDAITAEK